MPFAPINGEELFYAESGEGAPIIFGHGFAASHEGWWPVVSRLQDRFRCIVTDFRGAGESNQAKGPCTAAQFARDVVALADYLNLVTFTYAGLSMGGIVGMQLGVANADRLEKLILVASGPSAPSTGSGVTTRVGDLVKTGDESLIESVFRASLVREVSEEGEEYLRTRARSLLATSQEHLGIDASFEPDLGPGLATVHTPTLVVAGAADQFLASNLADFARLPNATLHVFSRVGHIITVDASEGLADVIADFMEHGVVTATTLQERNAASSR